ncbi:MAG: beta-galactosidase [Lachnospiraceae bacterium]|nr:beta-galactosidase [Lachnospiraceae bacterium]
MERGIYFDGWHHDGHCYHPSLPYRSMQMVGDLEKYKATVLVWSCLGGGSISLPYLENEAFGELDPRLRFYGFMNDSEFIRECRKRGIKPMGIVFEVQGWEFPAEISEDGKHLRMMNVLREGEGEPSWYGLNEFSSDRYPELFRTSLKDYYPEGIVNSDGEIVTELQEEGAARTFRGEPVHAAWVEVTGHSKTAYQMCRNNPVWRDYLKKIISLQLDAGVSGIQLDEAELPITSMGAGGCFCKDCVKQFRSFLQAKSKAGTLSKAYDGFDMEHFDFGQVLLKRGRNHPTDEPEMYRDFYEFQMRAVKKYFTELVDFARDYARKNQNREILVSGNFFNCMPVYYPFENTVDLVITEMDHTLFRQPHWYRYVNGFSGEKPVIVAENPYGGIVPQLVEQLSKGKAYDLYRLLLLEAACYGCNMSVPYGGWMGNTIRTGFWPPRDVTEEVQTFLADHDRDLSKASGARILVPYSFPSYYWREVTKKGGSMEQFTNVADLTLRRSTGEDDASRLPFWEDIRVMSEEQALYDVRMFGDGEMRPDRVSAEDWKQYELIVLPECRVLTENQLEELERFVRAGGSLLIQGETALDHPGWVRKMQELYGGERVVFVENPASLSEALPLFREAFRKMNAQAGQLEIRTKNPEDRDFIGVQTHRSEDRDALHLINYHYDEASDAVLPVRDVTVTLKLDFEPSAVYVVGLDGGKIPADGSLEPCGQEGGFRMTVHFDELPIYAVTEIIR